MAEQSNKQAPINKPIGGMSTDVDPIDQPIGSVRFAYNATIGDVIGAITTEKGNVQHFEITANYTPIGTIIINDTTSDTKLVVFLIHTVSGHSEIGIVSYSNVYTPIINDSTSTEKFDFNRNFPIEGEYKINATGEVSIYWTDDNNPPRFLNLSLVPSSPYTVNQFDVFPKIAKYPLIDLETIRSSGGALEVGAYQLSVAYVTEDGAPTSYLNISNPVYINDEPEFTAHQVSHSWGALADLDYNGAPGLTPSAKSILWLVSNYDTAYKWIQPVIVKSVNNGKEAVTIRQELIPLDGSPVHVLFTGLEESQTELLAAVEIPNESYTKAKTVTQVDDVLYWGNLEKDKIDIGYQKYANNITLYRKELNPTFEMSNSENVFGYNQSSITYAKYFGVDGYDSSQLKGYKRGEVYAFYITWVLKDGSETVAYHIPGRAPQTGGVNNPNSNPGNFNGILDNSTGPNWYYLDERDTVDVNTGPFGMTHPWVSQLVHATTPQPLYKFTEMMSFGNNERGFAYWQNANETYPSVAADVNNNFEIWSVDVNGNDVPIATAAVNPGNRLNGQNIRHHHFPIVYDSPEIHDVNSTDNASDVHAMNPQGITINNVPIPTYVRDLAVAYKIYYVYKETSEKKCVDYGMIQGGNGNGGEHLTLNGDAWMCSPFQWLGHNHYTSAETPFFVTEPFDSIITGTTIINIDYINIKHQGLGLGTPDGTSTGDGGFRAYVKDSTNLNFDFKQELHWTFDWVTSPRPQVGGNNDPFGLNDGLYVIKGKTRVPSGSILGSVAGFGYPVDNQGGLETMAMHLHESIEWDNHFHMIGDVPGTNDWYEGDTYVPPTMDWIEPDNVGYHNTAYVANFMSLKDDVHLGFEKQSNLVYTGYSQDITNLDYTANGHIDRDVSIHGHANGPVVMGGDVFIGYYAYDKYRRYDRFDYLNGTGPSATTIYEHSLGYDPGTSSPVVIFGEFKFEDKNYIDDYCSHMIITESRNNPYMRHAENDQEAFYPAYTFNHKAITDHTNIGKKHSSYNYDFSTLNTTRLTRAFDPDDESQKFVDFPTRIIRSIKYNQSGLEDNFRVYLPEDFRDLPRHRGELWKLKSYNNIVIPHMERSLYVTKGKEVLKMTDASEAFLGTGDLFEKDPAEVLLTDRGYGGTGSQYACVTSQFGYFFADKEAGKVFLLGEKLEEISMQGMRKFFRDNLNTGSQLEQFGLPKNYDNPIKGIGIIATYDPDLKRLILTKKDLRVKAAINWAGLNVTYDNEKRWWYTAAGWSVPRSYFEEYKEWSVSYDPTAKAWVSFHSYKPHLYFTDLLTFSSCDLLINKSLFYEHGSGNIGEYYDEDIQPFLIDCVDNTASNLNKLFTNVSYTVDVLDYVNNSPEIVNPFNYISVFNSTQVSQPMSTISGRRNERTWSFNNFRDDTNYVNNYPVTNNSIFHDTGTVALSIPGFQTSEFFIGFNSNYLNLSKSWDRRRKFVDKWLGIRLISTNIDNNFVSLYMIDTNKRISYR